MAAIIAWSAILVVWSLGAAYAVWKRRDERVKRDRTKAWVNFLTKDVWPADT